MGRRLTYSERASRDREREARASARRAKTASRRGQERKIRERQKAAEKRAKAAQTASEVAQNRSIVSKFENYIHNLESLHNQHDLNKFEKAYEYRLRKRAYKPGTIKEVTPFKKESFKIKSSKNNYKKIIEKLSVKKVKKNFFLRVIFYLYRNLKYYSFRLLQFSIQYFYLNNVICEGDKWLKQIFPINSRFQEFPNYKNKNYSQRSWRSKSIRRCACSSL